MTEGAAGRGAARAAHPHRNRWVLLDGRLALLAIGDEKHRGVSARSRLDPTARDLLLPRVREALRTGSPTRAHTSHSGRRWEVEVHPVVGTATGSIVGVQAIYGDALPERPLVGAWEWRVPAPTSGEAPRICWSPELFTLHGLPNPSRATGVYPAGPWWEGARYLDEVWSGSARLRMRELLTTMTRSVDDSLVLEEFPVREALTDRWVTLRMAGRPDLAHRGPVRWLRGLAHRVTVSVEQTDLLSAVFANPGSPIGVIDPAYRNLWMTSTGFDRRLGVWLPPTRSVVDMCHRDDLAHFSDLLERVAQGGAATLHRVRFATPDRGWRALEVSATSTRINDELHVLGHFTSLSG